MENKKSSNTWIIIALIFGALVVAAYFAYTNRNPDFDNQYPDTPEESTESQEDLLQANRWNIMTLYNEVIPEEITNQYPMNATFESNGTVYGTSACNNYNGTYETDGPNIAFGPMAGTLKLCSPVIDELEQGFRAMMGETVFYDIDEGPSNLLNFRNAEGEVIGQFTEEKPFELAGTSWEVISYNNGREAVTSTIIGTELTADFNSDGSLTGFSGCNNYSTSYQAGTENISISEQMAVTLKICEEPEGVMEQEQEYIQALPTAATYSVTGNTMEMRTSEGSLVGTFRLAN